jgi:hypothetical protein
LSFTDTAFGRIYWIWLEEARRWLRVDTLSWDHLDHFVFLDDQTEEAT